MQDFTICALFLNLAIQIFTQALEVLPFTELGYEHTSTLAGGDDLVLLRTALDEAHSTAVGKDAKLD